MENLVVLPLRPHHLDALEPLTLGLAICLVPVITLAPDGAPLAARLLPILALALWVAGFELHARSRPSFWRAAPEAERELRLLCDCARFDAFLLYLVALVACVLSVALLP